MDAIPPPPHTKGYLSDTCTIHHENKAKRVRYPPPATLSRKGIVRSGGYLALGRLALELRAEELRTFDFFVCFLASKGFLQSEVLGEVVRGEVFGEVQGEVLGGVFGVFCWDIQGKKIAAKTSAQKPPRLCAAKLAKIQGKTS